MKPLGNARIFFPKMILAFPSGFIFSVIRPLDFQEFGHLLTSSTFSFVEDADGMLLIGKIILQLEHLMIHCSVRRFLEAFSKLRHMEDVVDMRELRRQFQFICHLTTSSNNAKGT